MKNDDENTQAGSDCQEQLVRPDIIFDRCRYKWSERESGYFGNEESCGTYGAALDDGKWIPAWSPTDSSEAQWADESFDNPETAINRSHTYFS